MSARSTASPLRMPPPAHRRRRTALCSNLGLRVSIAAPELQRVLEQRFVRSPGSVGRPDRTPRRSPPALEGARMPDVEACRSRPRSSRRLSEACASHSPRGYAPDAGPSKTRQRLTTNSSRSSARPPHWAHRVRTIGATAWCAGCHPVAISAEVIKQTAQLAPGSAALATIEPPPRRPDRCGPRSSGAAPRLVNPSRRWNCHRHDMPRHRQRPRHDDAGHCTGSMIMDKIRPLAIALKYQHLLFPRWWKGKIAQRMV